MYRATAQVRFLMSSTDGAPHSVSMQFTLLLETGNSVVGYFYDPNRGQSLRTTQYVGANVPDAF
jgi:hypothetical protein